MTNWKKLSSVFALTTALMGAQVATFQALAEGRLTVAQARDPQNLDPIDTFLITWGSLGSNIFDGLILRDENLQLKPALATSWEFSEDNKRITFKLRNDVVFHNGEPFNAEAVKYTFERLLGEQGAKGPQQANYTAIERVEVIDDYTVDFHLNKPDPVLLTKLAGYGAMIVPPKYIEMFGEENFDKAPVGTGPFKVKQYIPGVGVNMERWPDYWNGTAKLDELQIRFIPEASTRINELLSGGVDVALTIPTTGVSVVRDAPNVDLVAVDGPTVWIFRFDTTKGITKDVRVRKAINMAIDRKSIIQALLEGYGKPISSAQGAKSFGYDPALPTYEFNPVEAKKMLEGAGVKSGTTITLDMANNNETFKQVGLAVAQMLREVGLKVEIRLHEANVFSSEIIPQGQTGEMFTFGWGGWTFDFDNTAYLLYRSGQHWNPYIKDEALDRLLEEQRISFDVEEREEILQRIAAYSHFKAFDVPLFNFSSLFGVSKRVEGFVPAPDERMRYIGVSVSD